MPGLKSEVGVFRVGWERPVAAKRPRGPQSKRKPVEQSLTAVQPPGSQDRGYVLVGLFMGESKALIPQPRLLNRTAEKGRKETEPELCCFPSAELFSACGKAFFSFFLPCLPPPPSCLLWLRKCAFQRDAQIWPDYKKCAPSM